VQAFFEQDLVSHPKAQMYFGFYAYVLMRDIVIYIANKDFMQIESFAVGRGSEITNLSSSTSVHRQILAGTQEILLTLLAKLPPNVQAWIKKVISFLEQEEQQIPGFVKLLVGALAANATGWNHAKFFSVNGTTSVASGYYWWDGYATGSTAPLTYLTRM
jgi:hypothetical protein